MLNKLLIASVRKTVNTVDEIFKNSNRDLYDISIDTIQKSFNSSLEKSIKKILKKDIKDIGELNITQEEKESLIKFVENDINKLYFKETMIYLSLEDKEFIKLFVEELKEYDEITQETIKEILKELTELLYFEAVKEENKMLNVEEIKLIETIKEEIRGTKKSYETGRAIKFKGNYYDKASDQIKDYIFYMLLSDIATDLGVYFDFKTENILGLDMEEYKQLQSILKDNDMKEHFLLNCLKNKVSDVEFLDEYIIKQAIEQMRENLYYKVIGATDQQQEIYRKFVNDILKSYEEIDNNTIEQIKENIEMLLTFKELEKNIL